MEGNDDVGTSRDYLFEEDTDAVPVSDHAITITENVPATPVRGPPLEQEVAGPAIHSDEYDAFEQHERNNAVH